VTGVGWLGDRVKLAMSSNGGGGIGFNDGVIGERRRRARGRYKYRRSGHWEARVPFIGADSEWNGQERTGR
jgi:hypothetical protein